MKIAYVVRQIDSTGGRERVLVNKANYFVNKFGYEVIIITMYQVKDGVYFELDNRIQVHHLNLIRPEQFKGSIFGYWKYVKRIMERKLLQVAPDITVSMWWGVEFKILPFIKDGSRKILEFHFSQYSRYLSLYKRETSALSKVRLLVTRWCENILVDRYEKLVVLTNEDKLHWRNRNVVVIPNALSLPVSNQTHCTNHLVISAGRLTEEKGFDRLIRIWSNLENEYSDWKLLIYGDGEEKDSLLGLINKMNLTNVFILPATVNLREEMLKSSIFVLTSRYEGFGMVLIEAMQCGLPVVSYDTKYGPRDIIDDNITGFLIKEGDEYSFRKRLSWLMNDRSLRLIMGTAAKQIVNQKYEEASIMNRWKTLFEKC